MWRLFGLAVWLVVAPSLAAQWSVAADVGMLAYNGGAFDTSRVADPAMIRPSPGRAYGLHVQRHFDRFGVGLGVLYSSTGVGAEGETVIVEQKGVLKFYEVAAEVLILLAQPGAGGALRLHLGPLLDVWSLTGGEEDRTRVGAQVAVSLDSPMIGPLTGTFQAGVALTPSPWEDGDLPDGYARRIMWRRGFAAGIRLRL